MEFIYPLRQKHRYRMALEKQKKKVATLDRAGGCRCPRREFQGCKFARAIVGIVNPLPSERQRGQEREKERPRGIGRRYTTVHPTAHPSAHVYVVPTHQAAPRASTRKDTDGCTVWVHRCCTRDTHRDSPRCGCMMYNHHRVVQWRICKPGCPPGVRHSPSPPFPSPPLAIPHRPHRRRNETVDTEGSRKSSIRACIFVHISLSPRSAFTFASRRDSLTLLAREKEPSVAAFCEQKNRPGRLFRKIADPEVYRTRAKFRPRKFCISRRIISPFIVELKYSQSEFLPGYALCAS